MFQSWKVREPMEDSTNATNVDKNWTCNWNRNWNSEHLKLKKRNVKLEKWEATVFLILGIYKLF